MAKGSSLYKSAKTARKIIIVFLLFSLIAILFNYISISGNIQIIEPPVGDNSLWLAPRNSQIFENIPTIKTFVNSNISISTESSSIYQLTGIDIIQIPDTAFVYKIETPSRGLAEIINAEEIAQKFGFTRDDFVNKETTTRRACPEDICIWENKSRKLTYNIRQKQWILKTDYGIDTAFRNNREFSSNVINDENIDNYYENIIDLLKDLGFSTSLFLSRFENKYFSFIPININFSSDFVYDRNISNAIVFTLRKNLLFASPKENLPRDVRLNRINASVYLSEYRKGNLKLISHNNFTPYEANIYEFEFYDRRYISEFAIRSIISPREAWTRIGLGEGVLVDLNITENPLYTPNKTIKVVEFRGDRSQTELAFVEPTNLNLNGENFAVPIYIFRGIAFLDDGSQNNFVFYVDAIKRF